VSQPLQRRGDGQEQCQIRWPYTYKYHGCMVGATFYYADANDSEDLLDYLGEGTDVTLHPWPLLNGYEKLSRSEATSSEHVLAVSEALGPPVLVGEGDPAMEGATVSGLFNRMNLASGRRFGGTTIVDFDATPVIFWQPGSFSPTELTRGSIGTQANSPGPYPRNTTDGSSESPHGYAAAEPGRGAYNSRVFDPRWMGMRFQALRKMKAPVPRAPIERKLTDWRAWVRKDAQRVLARMNEAHQA
jgi:hypothetical protein